MTRSLYVVGSINVDLTIETDRMPEKGETIKGKHFQQLPGGKGANQAIAASALGVNTYIVGHVGADDHGQFSIHNFQEYGVHVDFLQCDSHATTGMAMIIKSEADNRIILDLGANETVSTQTIDTALHHIQKGDVLLTQLENPLPIVSYALKQAKSKGALTLFNPAPAEVLEDSIYQFVDIIVVNETETQLLTQIAPVDAQAWQQAATVFLEKGVSGVIITLGEKGSVYIDRERTYFLPAYAIKTVDTTGAGDSFIGGFIAQRLQDTPIEEAMRFANAVSGFMCQIDGAQSKTLTAQSVRAFMQEHS